MLAHAACGVNRGFASRGRRACGVAGETRANASRACVHCLTGIWGRVSCQRMASRLIQLVLHYDGTGFHGWQRQPGVRTVQRDIEGVAERLFGEATQVVAAGRTDRGVHARGQAAGIRVPDRWTPETVRRALNALLPDDIWVAAAFEMR